MRRSVIAGAGLVALGAVAALAATSIAGGDDGDIVAADRGLRPLKVERVARPASGAPGTSREALRARQEVSYFQTPEPIVIPPMTEEAVTVTRCPQGSEAVSGYFATDDWGTFLDLNQPDPDSARRWRIGAYNSRGASQRAIFGVVCISDVR